MTRLAVDEAQENFPDTLQRVTEKGERIVLHSHGKDVAALVSVEDLALLEELEDRLDVEEAERRLADPSEVPVSYAQVRKELGLD
jgi:prevent-host-death family protein